MSRGRPGEDELRRSVAKQLGEAGIEYDMPLPLDTHRPAFGMAIVR